MLPTQPDNEKIKVTPLLITLILMFASLAQITADMYVPAMPAMREALATDTQSVQLTLSIYMFGFSFSHLYYGPLSDRIGRRMPMLIGIGLSVFGSLICALAPSITFVIIGRLIQGFGVGACNSVGRSLTRDMLSGAHLARFGSHLGMISVFVVALAPTIGGYIQHYFEWRAIFFVLFIYSFIIWIIIWRALPETNANLNADATKLNVILRNYRILLTNKTFMGYSLCACFAYAGLISYFTSAPFLLQNIVGLTPVQFGWLSLITASALFISLFINSHLIFKLGIPFMILIGNLLMLVSGIMMLAFGLSGLINTFVIMFPVALFAMGAGFTFSNAFAGAFHPFPQMAGAVGALYGCIQIIGAAITSAIIAMLAEHNQIPLAIIFTTLGILSFIALKALAAREESDHF